MLHPIARLHPCKIFISLNQASHCCINVRNYSRQHKQTNPDPRRNVRYPYVKGDPIHEDWIKNGNKKSALTILKEKDRNADNKKMGSMKQQTNIFETVEGLKFEKLLEGDIRLGRTILAAKLNNPNAPADTILLEGQTLITDALLLGAQVKSLYFSDPQVLNSLPSHLLHDVGLFKISSRDMKTWSDTVTPPGLLGVFQKPQEGEVISPSESTLPITLIFDSLKDPGNVGTLIRTAAAVGCQRVIAIKGTANVWDSKVLRSAMGGHFSVPIYSGLNWTDIPNYLDDGTHVFLANTWQSSTLASSFNVRLEGEDLDKALRESEICDSDHDSQFQENISGNHTLAEQKSHIFQRVPLAVCDYSNIVFSLPNCDNSLNQRSDRVGVALVVGRETEGLSSQAKRFAYKYYGQFVSIPMNQAVNSLNTAIAGSIILYELRKKLLEMYPNSRCSK